MCKMALNEFFIRWRFWTRPLLIIFYSLFVLIVVPLLIVNSVREGFQKKDQLVLIGGLFCLTAVPISFWHISQHLVHYTKPILQKHIIRILWMVPIYALNAWFGLLFPDASIYMDSIRECYEAYVIYNFMVYLLNYLNLEMDLEASLELKPTVRHIFPLCFLTPWEMGREFIHNCKHGILQYTVVRPITSIVSIICEVSGVYGEGNFSPNSAFPYLIAVNNVSQFIAMYCLVLFYQANKVELKPMKPVPKFLCIKAVIFFSFFQGVIINILVYFGYIKNIFGSDEQNDYKNLSAKLQDFLICIEMFFAAIAHHYSFSHDPFHINIPHYGPGGSWYNAFLAMLDVTDVQQDVTEHIGVVGSSLSRRFRGRSMYHMTRGSTESDYLIPTCSAPVGYQTRLNTGTVTALTNSKQSSNKYGAFDAGAVNQSNDGINIKPLQRKPELLTPNQGIPKNINLFNFNDDSLDMDSSTNLDVSKINSDSTSKSDSTTSAGINIKKSDSNNSDWLSTPSEEMLGIDVKGMENDRITYKNPRI